jgi:hypothetical protein
MESQHTRIPGHGDGMEHAFHDPMTTINFNSNRPCFVPRLLLVSAPNSTFVS